MKLIWTKSHLPLSLLIRSICREDCSHFAFVFNTRAKGVMFESNFLGTHIKFFDASRHKFEIVHELEYELTLEQEDKVWNRLIERYDGKRYDFGGAIYLGICILLNKFFNRPMPVVNIWSDPKAFFCDEVFESLHDIGNIPNVPVQYGMITPCGVYKAIMGAGK